MVNIHPALTFIKEIEALVIFLFLCQAVIIG